MVTKKGHMALDLMQIEFTFEVDERATDDEIDAACWEAGCGYIDCWWEEENHEID